MSEEIRNPLLLVLCRGTAGSRVAVDLESFLKFNARMDQDLRHLVHRWSDFAPPGGGLRKAGRKPATS